MIQMQQVETVAMSELLAGDVVLVGSSRVILQRACVRLCHGPSGEAGPWSSWRATIISDINPNDADGPSWLGLDWSVQSPDDQEWVRLVPDEG